MVHISLIYFFCVRCVGNLQTQTNMEVSERDNQARQNRDLKPQREATSVAWKMVVRYENSDTNQETVTLFLQIMMQTGPQQTPTLQTSLT